MLERCLFKFSQLIVDAIWDWMWPCVCVRVSQKVKAPAACTSFCFLIIDSSHDCSFKDPAERAHTHIHSDIMHGNIYWYSWPIFFLSLLSNECRHKHTARDSSPHLFPAITLNIQDAPTETGQTSLCSISANSRSSDSRRSNTGEKF